jgi:hypothetical protein
VIEAFLGGGDVRHEIPKVGKVVALRIAAFGTDIDADVAALAVIRIDFGFHRTSEPISPDSYSIFRRQQTLRLGCPAFSCDYGIPSDFQ